MKTYYLSFDDTDTKDSIGTGHVLEGFLTEAGIDFDYISRHQLYVHEEIPYTSHNSSMCAKIWTGRSETDLVAAAAAYLKTHAPLGSDPGLGVLALPLTGPAIELVLWGKAAKKSVLQKADAYALSQRCGVHLSEHGGDGQGVVGALAAIGLRLAGDDGRIRGKRYVDPGAWTVAELLEATGFEAVSCFGEGRLPDAAQVIFDGEPVKGVVQNFTATILVERDEDAYRPLPLDGMKRLT